MREGCEIATRSDRAVPWHRWSNSGVEEANELLNYLWPNSTMTLSKGVGTKEHRGPYDIFGHRRSDTGAMRTDKILLQLGEIFPRYRKVNVMTKPPVKSVGRLRSCRNCFADLLSTLDELCFCGGIKLNYPTRACNGNDIGDGKGDSHSNAAR
jgi:hypothetical protein